MVTTSIYLIPLLPLMAFAVNILFGKKVGKQASAISIASSLLSCLCALPLIVAVAGGRRFSGEWLWLNLGIDQLKFGYLIDPLAATLLFVVTIVGTLIQIYSTGYMHGDPRYSRFFAYVSLFMSAMLTLVIANNLVLFFIAWEIMGLCSYLLIGFWFEKDSAANAGLKAFLTTRIGDVCFLIGIFSLFAAIGTLEFAKFEGALKGNSHVLIPVAALLFLCGTIGKSAQFPLHVWLPDAMEGPTPVSALIHAATMVAAGVYLIARTYPVFIASPAIMPVVAIIGTITAFMAAFIALTATDIKRVLAYSTISQLGYMVTALGLGGFTAGTFHLMTHAYFKALLFLGAGSVIHGTGTQDIRNLGGIFGKMKSTAITFLIASLAIAGVPPLSGFWSKDEVLSSAFHSGNMLIYAILLLTAFMTSFYMFRLVFLTFFGKARDHQIHAHESPNSMTVPLWILAVGAALLGLPASPWLHNWFQTFLTAGHAGGEHEINRMVMASSIGVALGGILLAAVMYLWVPALAGIAGKLFRPLYWLSIHKFWIDEIYDVCLIRPFLQIGKILYKFDERAVDGCVNGTGWITLLGGKMHNWCDHYIVDGLVNFVGALTQFLSRVTRRLQTGLIQNYLLIIFLGVLILIYFEMRS
ncbi:MAG: NADH-quinone oxidoreductase subunit L [Candidatus Omnitrophica bacterium]|nr:NADH-quinone oxidoreductase subunit L [Candidatus Omnitrophota bacterium]MDD5670283.1 NADH-quinone oxidoreductase subunit L [Candidatus Omnitrophota bacterium]